MKQNIPEVSVIIANYNGEHFLNTCLRSLLSSSFQNFEVIITDDGSTDGSTKIINSFKNKSNKILLVQNEKNMGASASRNKAVALAQGKYLLFLDNDTEITKDCLSKMVHTMGEDSIGACQALLLDFENREKIQNAGVRLWAATGWGLPEYQWQNYRKLALKERDIVAISAGMMVKKDIFENVGGFDELESVVTEDLDFSWRIWLAGYRIVLSPQAVIYHMTKNLAKRKNMKHTSATIYFHLTKNSLISIIKNYQIGNVVKYVIYSSFISFARGIVVLMRRGDTSSIRGTMKGFFWILLRIPLLLVKRKQTQALRKVSDKDLFENVIMRASLFAVYKKYFSQSYLL